jgi:DNA-binding MarR family transcriptional regulator
MSKTDRTDPGDEEPSRRSDARLDALLLDHLLLSPWPWTLEELAREIQEKGTDTADAVARLTEAGLVHRLDRFVSRRAPHVALRN